MLWSDPGVSAMGDAKVKPPGGLFTAEVAALVPGVLTLLGPGPGAAVLLVLVAGLNRKLKFGATVGRVKSVDNFGASI